MGDVSKEKIRMTLMELVKPNNIITFADTKNYEKANNKIKTEQGKKIKIFLVYIF